MPVHAQGVGAFAQVESGSGESGRLGNRRVFLQIVERSEEHTSELQSLRHLVCRLLLEKKKKNKHVQYNMSSDTKQTFSRSTIAHIHTHCPNSKHFVQGLLCFLS